VLQLFVFGNEPIWKMSPLQKKKKSKLWRLPKVEDSMEGWNSSLFGPIM